MPLGRSLVRRRAPLLLALLFASAPVAAEPTLRVDAGGVLAGRASVNAGRAELQPLAALRGAWLLPAGESGLVYGGDLRLLLETLPRTGGTADVGSSSWELALEPRALVGWRLGDGPLSLLPYGFAGALVGGRASTLRAFGDDRLRGQATYGATLGAGATLRLGFVTLTLELGGGLREDGPTVSTALLTGVAF